MNPAPTFPGVAAAAPALAGIVLWAVWGSPFALVGAVMGPIMVLAHFWDSRRRHSAHVRRELNAARRANDARIAESTALAERARADENRRHPSVDAIVKSRSWAPPLDGSTLIRAGSVSRDGVAGFPWRIDVSSGVAVVGEGAAADSVVRSLLVGMTASLGPSESSGAKGWSWPGGIRLSRFDDSHCAISVRCHANTIESITHRGTLPEPIDAHPDHTRGWEGIVAMCGARDEPVDWDDRAACAHGVGIDSAGPVSLDPSSTEPHIAIAGRTGSGKSEFVAALLSDWAERFPPETLSWVGFDFKGGATLRPLAHLANCRGVETDLDAKHAERVWIAIAAEIVRREKCLSDEGVSCIDESRSVSRLVIVIDEYPELLRQVALSSEIVGSIARRGRSLGIHLVVASQSVSALTRDGLLANLTTRICFPLGGSHEGAMFLGSSVKETPRVGRPVVGFPDGSHRVIRVRCGAARGTVRELDGPRLPPLTHPPLETPLRGIDGFGLTDDPRNSVPTPARWSPSDGDIVVVGCRGSGRSTAIAALTRGAAVTHASTVEEIERASGVVVIDDVDWVYSEMSDRERLDLVSCIDHRRLGESPPTIVMSTTRWMPRVHGVPRNVVTLSTLSRDEHVVTGEPSDTFDPQASPGVGSWKGRRVVIYARTDSIVTEEIP